jgi:hypothetical protein
LRVQVEQLRAEIERLRLACDCHPESICGNNKRLRAEVERLRTQCGGNCRYWEGRWRDEAAENERLTAVFKDLRERSVEEGIQHFVKLIDAALENKP